MTANTILERSEKQESDGVRVLLSCVSSLTHLHFLSFHPLISSIHSTSSLPSNSGRFLEWRMGWKEMIRTKEEFPSHSLPSFIRPSYAGSWTGWGQHEKSGPSFPFSCPCHTFSLCSHSWTRMRKETEEGIANEDECPRPPGLVLFLFSFISFLWFLTHRSSLETADPQWRIRWPGGMTWDRERDNGRWRLMVRGGMVVRKSFLAVSPFHLQEILYWEMNERIEISDGGRDRNNLLFF